MRVGRRSGVNRLKLGLPAAQAAKVGDDPPGKDAVDGSDCGKPEIGFHSGQAPGAPPLDRRQEEQNSGQMKPGVFSHGKRQHEPDCGPAEIASLQLEQEQKDEGRYGVFEMGHPKRLLDYSVEGKRNRYRSQAQR